MSHPALGNGPGIEVRAQEHEIRPQSQVWAIALAAGVAAGVVSGVAGEFAREAFKPQVFSIKIALTTHISPNTASLNAADLKNATLVFAILGAVTGAAMGIAGGYAGRSVSRGLVVGFGGLVAGGLVGALASRGLFPLFFRRSVPDPNDLVLPILVHGGIWMAIGAVGGLAFGLGSGRGIFNAFAGGCLGGLFATLLFHGLGEALFPDSGSTAPVAASILVRLLAVFLVTILIACGAAKGTLGRISRHATDGKDTSPALT